MYNVLIHYTIQLLLHYTMYCYTTQCIATLHNLGLHYTDMPDVHVYTCTVYLVMEVLVKLESGQSHAGSPVTRPMIQHLCHPHHPVWNELLSKVLGGRGGRMSE